MPKKSTPDARKQLRQEFYEKLNHGAAKIDLRAAVKTMRRIVGMTQTEYALFCKISPRSLIDFERGAGNPTLSTLEALLKPFNLQLTVGIKQKVHQERL